MMCKLINGETAYPHRPDLYELPFWQCPFCRNFVGTHHKTRDRLRPLGVIATQAIKNYRIKIHNAVDKLWKNGSHKRGSVYMAMSRKLGYSFHTSAIRTLEEAKHTFEVARTLANELNS